MEARRRQTGWAAAAGSVWSGWMLPSLCRRGGKRPEGPAAQEPYPRACAAVQDGSKSCSLHCWSAQSMQSPGQEANDSPVRKPAASRLPSCPHRCSCRVERFTLHKSQGVWRKERNRQGSGRGQLEKVRALLQGVGILLRPVLM